MHYAIKIGSNKVHLVGMVSVEPAFGPPNFGEDPKHDSREDFLAISLSKPICVKALDNDKNEADEDEDDVKLLQLVYLSNDKYRKAQSLIGKEVSVVGSLMHRETGHHHTEVLIIVDKARVLSKGERQ